MSARLKSVFAILPPPRAYSAPVSLSALKKADHPSMLGRISFSRMSATAFQSLLLRPEQPLEDSGRGQGGAGSSPARSGRTASGNTPLPMALKTAPASWKKVPRDSMQAA